MFLYTHLDNFMSRLNVIPYHALTFSVSELDNAAAQTGAGTSFRAKVKHIHEQREPSLAFCVS